MSLKGSQTEQNLKDAFAGESQANRRYLYFAAKADVEGFNDVSAVFRSTAEGETGHAHGHLEYLEETGIQQQDCQSVIPRITSRHRLPEKPTNTPTCIREWRRLQETKVSMKLPTGSKLWPKPNVHTLTASRKHSITSTLNPLRIRTLRGPESFTRQPTCLLHPVKAV